MLNLCHLDKNKLLYLLTDYVGFIKKCMKQMQKPDYHLARKVDLEIKQLDENEAPLSPGNMCSFISVIYYHWGWCALNGVK